jgi:hypothetical protein
MTRRILLKSFLFAMLGLLTAHEASAELGITKFTRSGTVVWTNSPSNAVYRVESATSLSGPWTVVDSMESIQSSNQQTTVELGTAGAELLKLYRVTWTNVPPAQPIGTWTYRGFEGTTLVVTGWLSISATNPIAGTCDFRAVGNPNQTKHPVGNASFDGTMPTANVVTTSDIPLQSGYPRLRGQMALDEYWGTWSYNDVYIDILTGRSRTITRSGSFSARRQQ